MEDTDPLLWHEVSPGRYQRDIDEVEQFYTSSAKVWEGTGHTYFAITSSVRISIPMASTSSTADLSVQIERALRSAWKRLRYDHPALAAPVRYDVVTKRCKKVYQIPPDDKAVERRIDESFKVIDHWKSGTEFANEDSSLAPYPILYLVVPPSNDEDSGKKTLRRDIVFRSHHDIIDGIGTLILLNSLLEHTSTAFSSASGELETHYGDEHKNLSPPFRIAAEIRSSPSVSQRTKLASTREVNATARIDSEILALPFKSGVSMPLKSQRLAIYLTPEQSQSIITKCKEYSATPTHAFHAAIALAVRDVQPRTPESRNARYISYSLINLRKSCKAPYDSAKYAAAVYHCVSSSHLVVDLEIPSCCAPLPTLQESRDEFFLALNQVKTFYHNSKVDEDYLAIVPALFTAVTPPYPVTPCDVPAPNPAAAASLSSMGIVDMIIKGQYGEIAVDDPWVIGNEYGTGLGLFLKTWKGRLEVSAAFNEAFHDDKEVREFLEGVRRWVLEGFGVIGDDGK